MSFLAASIYWAIVAVWFAILGTMLVFYIRDPRAFGATKLLLSVLAIDAARNIVENFYFGIYFGAQYGFFPRELVRLLGNPNLLILPKLVNVIAALLVLSLLLLRWLPTASKERMNAERELREAESRLRLVVAAVKEYAIYMLDSRGRVATWNSGAERIKGYTADEVIGTTGARFYTQEERAAGTPKRALEIARREGRYEQEGSRVRKDGTRFWANVVIEAVQDEAGTLIGFANVTQDVSERKIADDKLRQLAHYDQLTGLPNRATLSGNLDAMASAGGRGQTASIAMFDLDGFKEINDTLGHSTGDKLLQEVAQRLQRIGQDEPQVYRLGGDEFVLLFRDSGSPLPVSRAVEAMLTRLAEPFDVCGHRLFIGASAGIATAPSDGSSADDLLSSADLALYDAKAAGGRTYRVFLPILRANAQARRDLKADLRRAFAAKEFILHFQPQMRLSDGAVVGAEALLRWNHPDRGILGPGAFIEALAESPIVLDVGRWIMRAACEHAAKWRAAGFPQVRVGVNLFPAQIHDRDLLRDVEAALLLNGLPCDALELEITENIALGQDDIVLEQLKELRERGVHLAFDDFGTGYASLSYLARFPLTRIKIDQSFVRKVTDVSTPQDTAILRATIGMAHSLDLKVIAEGVETSLQAAFLAHEGCDEVQGFLYAKPLAAKDFECFLARQRSMVSMSRTG